MKINKNLFFILFIGALSFVTSGCNYNLFKFLHTDSGTPDEHIAEGKRLMSRYLYKKAAEEFQKAIDIGVETDDRVTDAYYLHAQAASREFDVDPLTVIMKMMTAAGSTDPTGLLEGFSMREIKNMYEASDEATDDLYEVFASAKSTCTFRGEIKPEHVYFDLMMCATIKAVTCIFEVLEDLSGALDKFMITFSGGGVNFSDPAAWAALSSKEQDDFKKAASNALFVADTVVEVLYPDQSSEMKTMIGDISGFVNGL